jgi:CHAT domain-containing protein/tetratricopeptide (TPR) repeat protein
MRNIERRLVQLNTEALALYERNELETALTVAQAAIALSEELVGDRSQRIVSLNNVGLILSALGQLVDAAPYYAEIRQVLDQSPNWNLPARAILLQNIAAFYQEIESHADARDLYEEAANLLSATLGEHSEDFASVSANLGDLLYDLGAFENSEVWLARALAIYRELDGGAHPADVLRVLDTMGALRKMRGDYVGAEAIFRQALDLQQATPDISPALSGALLNNIASLYTNTARIRLAEEYYRRALDLWTARLGPNHPNVASALHNLGELYAEVGDLEQAARLYGQSLRLRRSIFGSVHPDVADTLNGLASVSYRIHDYAKAADRYRSALEIRRAMLPAEHPSIAQTLNNLGAVHLALGQFDRAEPLFREALEMDAKILGADHPLISAHLYNLASATAALGNAAGAFELRQGAATIDGTIIDQIFSLNSDAQRLQYLTDISWRLNWFLSLIVDHLQSDDGARQALDLVLRRKALGAEALGVQRDAVLGGRYPQLRERVETLTAVRAEVASLTLGQAARAPSTGARERLAELEAREQELDAELSREISEMRVNQRLRAANRHTVAGALPSESVLVEFVRSERFHFGAIAARGEDNWLPARYVAFVLPADAPDEVTLINLGDAERIDASIARCTASLFGARRNAPPSVDVETEQPVAGGDVPRKAIAYAARELASEVDAPHIEHWAIDSATLRRLIFDPLVTALKGRIRIIFAPDGDLARVPFQALSTDEGGFLIDRYTISYVTVGRDVLRVQNPSQPTTEPPIVAADPDFDLGSATQLGTPFRRLPGTRVEGQVVAHRLGQPALMDGAVTEKTLKAARAPRILHLATHGFFVASTVAVSNQPDILPVEAPLAGPLAWLGHTGDPLLRSGLALAGANTWLAGGHLQQEAEDGLLMARDVAGLDLLGTELVVLSACETGLGQIQIGEGVFGLRRAFAVAGARVLVMSLWKVPDAETATLMEAFYSQLLQGNSAVDALHTAQAALRRDGHDVYAWGAFICEGAWPPATGLGPPGK